MSERDELARAIAQQLGHGWAFEYDNSSKYATHQRFMDAADAMLAAGYRKPHAITTAEELDALPEWSVVRSEQGTPWEKCAGFWAETLGTGKHPASHIALPATVLWEPK